MIKLQIIGHLGKDCVVNNVNGKNVINWSVAHAEKYKDAQGVEHNKTTWVDCAWWTDRMGIAPYLKKGQQVYVEGQPEIKQYKTQDNQFRANIGLRVMQVQLLGGANRDNSQQQSNNTQQTYGDPNDLTEPLNDLPF